MSAASRKGARFERVIADHLAATVDDRIDRRVKTGAKDCGDIANLRTRDGRRIVVEAKDYSGRYHVAEWLAEAEVERVNDGALAGVVIAKRRGVADPSKQVCFMTVADLTALIRGER